MQNKALLLITLLITSGSVVAEQGLLGNAGKQLMKDSATSAAPTEAVEGAGAAGQKLEAAKTLKDSVSDAPDALKDHAKDKVMDSAKEKATEAVPEKAKEGLKTVESGAKSAKKMKGVMPSSSGEATKAVKGKVQEEAAKKALKMVK